MTILRQLGGGRFMAMTGASAVLGNSEGTELQFSIPRSRGINKVRIVLDRSDDTYDVAFYSIGKRGLSVREVAKQTGVYAEDLQRVFTTATGLDTSL
jgi:hypothetical protein